MKKKTAKKKNEERKHEYFYLDLLQRRETMLMIIWVNSTQIKSACRWLAYSFLYLWCYAKYPTFIGLKNTIYKLRAECIPEIETYWVTQKQTCTWKRQVNYPNLNKNCCDNIFHEKKKYLPPIPQSYLGK